MEKDWVETIELHYEHMDIGDETQKWTTFRHIEFETHSSLEWVPKIAEFTRTLCGEIIMCEKLHYYVDKPTNCPDCISIVQLARKSRLRAIKE